MRVPAEVSLLRSGNLDRLLGGLLEFLKRGRVGGRALELGWIGILEAWVCVCLP